jgi:NarL family two-component system response regulator LiaR
MADQTDSIRLLLVDDHVLIRRGLTAFLDIHNDLELVGEAADGAEAIQMCHRLHPDVVLMDLSMPRMDGATATRAIREQHPDIQVLILTSFKEDKLVQDALKAGAVGYLLKNVTAEELAAAIRSAHKGRPTLAPEAARVLIHAATQHGVATIGNNLSEREHEVLGLMAKGLDNNQIAKTLYVSAATVKFHVSNILSKLHAQSRTEAVAIALQHNLVAKEA